MYAIISDVHLHNWSVFASTNSNGENTRLRIILDEIRTVANQLVHKQASNRRMYIAGDLFHVRGKIAPSVLNPTLELFRELSQSPYDIEFRIIPGNHDLESKDTNALNNAVQALESIGCVICNVSTVFHDDNVVMIPWYDKLDELRAEIQFMADEVEAGEHSLIIHAPLNGVIKGLPDLGLSPDELLDYGFQNVFCGHYHNHVRFVDSKGKRSVYSVGALTHQTWSDVATHCGGLLVDAGSVSSVESFAPRFVDYDLTWSEAEAEVHCEGNYIRMRLEEATEKEILELREQLKSWGALGSVIEARPKPKEAVRSGSVQAGASLSVSVAEWIDANVQDAKEAVQKECDDVLGMIGSM